MTHVVIPRRPTDTLALVDCALPVAVAGLGAAVAAFVVGRGLEGVTPAVLVPGGWLLGLVLTRIYPHRFRVLGLAPLTSLLALALVGGMSLLAGPPDVLVTVVALLQGLTLGALLRYRNYQNSAKLRVFAVALLGMVAAAAAVMSAAAGVRTDPDAHRGYSTGVLAGCLVLVALIGWCGFARHAVEMVLDFPMRVLYRCRVTGPGADAVPRTGPVLVIANHAAWFDPLFIAEAVHRETAPMMTAGFYDLPGLAWLMRSVFRVIRVEDTSARRDVPEIRQAVAALDVGQCVVIFPEGYLRRKEEFPLRRFGRGVWQILKDRPETPVVCCWIEGSWGSYFSHCGGPPTKNKRFDLRRNIQVGVSMPVTVPADVLSHHLTARLWLMNRVSEARAHLGLEPLPAVDLPGEPNEPGDTQ